jgi:hypothetical protein
MSCIVSPSIAVDKRKTTANGIHQIASHQLANLVIFRQEGHECSTNDGWDEKRDDLNTSHVESTRQVCRTDDTDNADRPGRYLKKRCLHARKTELLNDRGLKAGDGTVRNHGRDRYQAEEVRLRVAEALENLSRFELANLSKRSSDMDGHNLHAYFQYQSGSL